MNRARVCSEAHVPARHADAADANLAGLTPRDRLQLVVKEVHAIAGDRASDPDRLAGDEIGIRGDDSSLRGAVRVQHPPPGPGPARDELLGARLATEDEKAHGRYILGEHRQQRWYTREHGHAQVGQHPREVGPACAISGVAAISVAPA